MLAIEISSKVYKPKTYGEVINNLIHGRQWKEAIEDEIQNLENHHTWEYNNLLSEKKTVGSK